MMRNLAMILLCFGPATGFAQSNLTIPWDEFRSLYTEQLRHDFEQERVDDTPPAVLTIAEASYRVSLSGPNAVVDIELKGKVLQGRPDPIELFKHDLAITEILIMQGGTLIGDGSGYRFFTESGAEFEIALKAALTIKEDQHSQFVAFSIPSAVKNQLQIDVTDKLELLDAPGIKQPDGHYYFSPETQLEIRFNEALRADATLAPSLDTFTKVALQGNKYVLTTTFVPNQRLPAELLITFPAPLGYLDTSLRRSFVRHIDRQRIALSLPRDWMSPFTLRFESAISPELSKLGLPAVVSNEGREGEFQLVQPVEARIAVSAEELERDLSSARLSEPVQQNAQVVDTYLAVPANSVLSLTLERFDAVDAPDVVLDAIHFYTSFAENGTAISVLRLDLPATPDNRLQLKSIPGAEIWSVTVNGAERSLYTHQQGVWIVPLPEQVSAVVELTYIQKREKLGLEGQLPVTVPETGLAAQRVFVGIALAERVELIALESDLTPSDGTHWPRVKSFAGTAYYFEYPFYRGESLTANIYYKEPLTDG